MIYESYFSKEWDSLTRDEAMVRAFVLGIGAVREAQPDDEELDRLREANNRAFVEMAYEAGKRECLNLDEETESETNTANPEADGFSAKTSEILSELVVSRPESPDRTERENEGRIGEKRKQSQVDVPAMLDEYDFLDTRRDDRDRLDLPDFLER